MANVNDRLSAVLRERVTVYRAKLAYASHVRRLVRPIDIVGSVSIVAIQETELSGRELIDSQLRRYRREQNAT